METNPFFDGVLKFLFYTLPAIAAIIFLGLVVRYGDISSRCNQNNRFVKFWAKKPKKHVRPIAWFPD